jgi:predicted ATPase/class 3 adenylate cyclase
MLKALTLVMTDVVDSTQVNERLGDERMRVLWERHDALARDLIRTWRGTEVGRSDGFLVVFEAPSDAVEFALSYHRALAGLEVRLWARAGIHSGSLTVRANRSEEAAHGATPFEVDGIALPVTARVMAVAQSGQTLTTEATLCLLHRRGLRRLSHGHWRLKGLEDPLELIEIGDDDAPFVSPPDTQKAYRVVQHGGVWTTIRDLPNSLPAERDSFVGRLDALKDLGRQFEDGARLVTLAGIGGVGKTRLALTYARAWLGSYPGGAWFCDLDAARGVDGIVHAALHGLQVPAGPGDPIQLVAEAIAARGRCLVVLDTFEQIARHAETTAGAWLTRAPEANFLVTSREVLRIAGEHAQVLLPLAVADAETLFRHRIKASGLPAKMPDVDEKSIAPLMALLDCLPLAIELAAARTRVLSPAAMLQRMDERFKLLVRRGEGQGRQTALRATLDWSWELLTISERSTLMHLSVFESGASLEAAESVIGPTLIDASEWVPDLLQALVEKSLVQRVGAQRFELLRAVQDYAGEHLANSREAEAAKARHWRWFAAMDQKVAEAHRDLDGENIVVACRRAMRAEPAAAVSLLRNAWAVIAFTGPYSLASALARELKAVLPSGDSGLEVVQRVARSAESFSRLGLATTHRIDVLPR